MKIAKIAATLVVALCTMSAAETSARDIMVKVKDHPDGDTRSSSMEMKLVNKNGGTRVRKITSFAMDVGADTKTIMFFQYPRSEEHTSELQSLY